MSVSKFSPGYMASRLRLEIATSGREVASATCRAWIEGARRPAIKARREVVGKELGLIDPGSQERAAEEKRRARLYSCPMHVFDMSGIERVAGKVPARLTCVMCDEWMPTLEAAAYARGYEAYGGDPNAVIPGFTA